MMNRFTLKNLQGREEIIFVLFIILIKIGNIIINYNYKSKYEYCTN